MNVKCRLSTLIESYLTLKTLDSFDSLNNILSEDVAFASLSFSFGCGIVLPYGFRRLLDKIF